MIFTFVSLRVPAYSIYIFFVVLLILIRGSDYHIKGQNLFSFCNKMCIFLVVGNKYRNLHINTP